MNIYTWGLMAHAMKLQNPTFFKKNKNHHARASLPTKQFMGKSPSVAAESRRNSEGETLQSQSRNSVICGPTVSVVFSFASANESTVQRGEVALLHIEGNLAERRNIQRTPPPGQL